MSGGGKKEKGNLNLTFIGIDQLLFPTHFHFIVPVVNASALRGFPRNMSYSIPPVRIPILEFQGPPWLPFFYIYVTLGDLM